MKVFKEALKDGFKQVLEMSPETSQQLRREGVFVDAEGYYSCAFGDKLEFEVCLEPMNEENTYQVAIYKNRILLTEKLLMKGT